MSGNMERSLRMMRMCWAVGLFLVLGIVGCGTPEVEREPALAAWLRS